MGKTNVCVLIKRVDKYFSVLESALLLGGKRSDKQRLDEIGWWVRSIALEFCVPEDKLEEFERNLRDTYPEEIFISIGRVKRAALPV